MRTCPSCSSPAADADRFCGRCGSRLGTGPAPAAGRFCTQCGGPVTPTARFCGRCGADIAPAVIRADDVAVPALAPRERIGSQASVGSGFAREDEDLLAEWEEALRIPEPSPRRIEEEAAVTETIVRPPAAPITDVHPVFLPATPEAPAPRPVTLRSRPAVEAPPQRTPFRFPLGATLALLGAVAVVISGVLPWKGPFRDSMPVDIPVGALLDPETEGGISLGIVLLVAGTAGALMALLTMAMPLLKPIRRVVGLLTLLLPVGFALRTLEAAVADGEITALWAGLGTGVYVAAAGALVELVAGRWFRR
ncbi:MAG: zinc ribbon domain-containing protein [Actinomycetota bacterium]|nr:zinc ribbon domain-containing protein [Actinomycetota bacterium]